MKKKVNIGGIAARYAGRTVLWAVALALLSFAAPWSGVTLGTGALSACALGALGAPGFALLLCVKTMFG